MDVEDSLESNKNQLFKTPKYKEKSDTDQLESDVDQKKSNGDPFSSNEFVDMPSQDDKTRIIPLLNKR